MKIKQRLTQVGVLALAGFAAYSVIWVASMLGEMLEHREK